MGHGLQACFHGHYKHFGEQRYLLRCFWYCNAQTGVSSSMDEWATVESPSMVYAPMILGAFGRSAFTVDDPLTKEQSMSHVFC